MHAQRENIESSRTPGNRDGLSEELSPVRLPLILREPVHASVFPIAGRSGEPMIELVVRGTFDEDVEPIGAPRYD
jgi:hypothetical protein